jgi:hypothetical protein
VRNTLLKGATYYLEYETTRDEEICTTIRNIRHLLRVSCTAIHSLEPGAPSKTQSSSLKRKDTNSSCLSKKLRCAQKLQRIVELIEDFHLFISFFILLSVIV